MPGFSDQQIRALLGDPNFTPDDFSLLQPDEQQKYLAFKSGKGMNAAGQAVTGPQNEDQSYLAAAMNGVKDLGIGAAKGAGSTVTNLGNLLRMVPGVNSLDKIVKPVEFSTTPDNTAQSIGKGAEQIGEFMTPMAMGMRGAAIKGLVSAIPDSASAASMKFLNKAAAVTGRMAGEAGNAAVVSTAHNTNPDMPALIAGASPLAAEGVAAVAPLLQNPTVQKVLSAMLGGAAAHTVGSAGMGMSLGTFGAARGLATDAMKNLTPKVVGKVARKAIPQFGRFLAGADSESEK